MLVEDESIIAMHIETLLDELGYIVTGVYASGEDALERIEQEGPDILLLDIMLKGRIDGIQTAEIVNEEHGIPVIYLTAHSDRDTLNRAKKTEPYGYILKPVDDNKIYTEIELAYNKFIFTGKLQQSNQRYQMLFNSNNDSVSLFNLSGDSPENFLEVNDITCETLGYSREELLKINYMDLVSENDRNYVRSMFQRLDEKKRVLFEIDHIKKDETSLPCEVSAHLFDFQGRPIVIANARDISDRKRVEEQMKLKDSAIEASINAIIITDLDFRIQYFNRSFLTMWGLKDPVDVMGRSFFDIYDSRNDISEIREDLISKGKMIGEISFSDYEGFHKEAKYAASLIEDRNGSPAYYMSSFIDITEQKRLEKEIMKISEIERQSMGQDLHDGLGQKLTGIAFLVEALKQTMEENVYPELGEILEIKKHVDESIEQTRKIAKGLCPVNLESFGIISALEELAADTTDVFRVRCSFQKKGYVNIKDSAVSTNLYFIVREAINNAIKHGSAKNIDIKLVASEKLMSLTVTDDGSGEHGSGKKKPGMGLMIMKYRAEMIGGNFYAENIEKGFSVKVELPR